MIDKTASYRKGSVIVEISAEIDAGNNPIPGSIARNQTDYKSINKAKKANRLTKYRVIPHKEARRKVNGVWVS